MPYGIDYKRIFVGIMTVRSQRRQACPSPCELLLQGGFLLSGVSDSAYSPAMQEPGRQSEPVAVFDRVAVASEAGPAGGTLSFELAAGELVLIRTDRDLESLPLAELALGLVEPAGGCVRFEGRDWSAMSAFEQAAARGRCGVVFNQSVWVSSLPVPENIALRLEHATSLASDVILDDAAAKARLAGLETIDARRPDFVSARELRVLEWVRAFAGRPELVVLICPEEGAPDRMLPGLAALVQQATGQGAAVLWVSRSRADGLPAELGSVRELRIQDDELAATPREAQA